MKNTVVYQSNWKSFRTIDTATTLKNNTHFRRNMIPVQSVLKYYARRDVQEEIALCAREREVAPKYGEHFGKRPDTIQYPNDVFELAKKGATSFHCSEERWKNPLQLSATLSKQQQDELRSGWDLLIDIDCPHWEFSKLIAHAVVESLQAHGISCMSCKFSGNKGFHIGVPFEAFPKKVQDKETRILFPDIARIIAGYLVDAIDRKGVLTKKMLSYDFSTLQNITGKSYHELVVDVCSGCGEPSQVPAKKFEYICPQCLNREISEDDELLKSCKKCAKPMEKKALEKSRQCGKCGAKEFISKFNLRLIMNIDAILISPRHLFRMPYSLHEKTGLVSLPIDSDRILMFEKEQAKIEALKISSQRFLDPTKAHTEEAALLFEAALSWHAQQIHNHELRQTLKRTVFERQREMSFEQISQAIPKELFPPCILLLEKGITDGKKRALFILVNFLCSVGWDYAAIEEYLVAWNKKNNPPLKEVVLLGQLRYHKQHAKKVLPPNCDNEMYMKGIGVCRPDGFCARIKNPANYAIVKARQLEKTRPKKKKGADTKENVAEFHV